VSEGSQQRGNSKYDGNPDVIPCPPATGGLFFGLFSDEYVALEKIPLTDITLNRDKSLSCPAQCTPSPDSRFQIRLHPASCLSDADWGGGSRLYN
jgi:hypothetical protein